MKLHVFLEMGFNIENISSRLEHYSISVLFTITRNGLKLLPFKFTIEIYSYIANHKDGVHHIYSKNGLK